jgi:thioredoxin reductase (NADPH)
MMFDIIVAGAGPAGIAAAIYAKRYNLEVLIIEKEYILGGKVLYPHWIENFIGIPEGISGAGLSEKLQAHLEFFKIPLKNALIQSISKNDKTFTVSLSDASELQAKAIVLAQGTKERSLGIPGEKEYKGRGVSSCATCDAPFFKHKTLAVIGGGNSALAETIYLAEFASKLHLVHRRMEFRGAEILAEQLLKNPIIQPHLGFTALEIRGDGQKVSSLLIENLNTKKQEEVFLDGLFIFAGYEPDTSFLTFKTELDDAGFIKTNENMETGIPGLYAAGDIRSKSLRQIITALSDGSIAAHSARDYIKG